MLLGAFNFRYLEREPKIPKVKCHLKQGLKLHVLQYMYGYAIKLSTSHKKNIVFGTAVSAHYVCWAEFDYPAGIKQTWLFPSPAVFRIKDKRAEKFHTTVITSATLKRRFYFSKCEQ